MSDDRRGLLTESERKILLGEKEVSDNYYYTVSSRVNKKISRLEDDLEALEEAGKLDDLRRIICCENPEDSY
ncbi:hypothetical protein [Natrinema soli]|uniref:Uncharacterized protein n=1 Tax=Natrinema soli TaxID=1930624 RepID=A0ABD5SLJ7_9EURY|nr:hypothetical protein [Natrinema soli]